MVGVNATYSLLYGIIVKPWPNTELKVMIGLIKCMGADIWKVHVHDKKYPPNFRIESYFYDNTSITQKN
jgi:hypothetical protein